MVRVCSCCDKPMTEGYCIRDGEEYFCSDDCLSSTYSPEEYDELCQEDLAYWTSWEGAE